MLESEVNLYERPPFRPLRLADEMQPSLVRRAIGLPGITRDTGTDDIFPCGWPPAVTWDDMVEVQVLPIKLAAAVLAGVLVALEDVVPGKLHFLLGDAIEEHQQDHPGNPDAKGNRVNTLRMRLLLRKIVPFCEVVGLERAVVIVEYHLGTAFEQKR